MRSSLTGSCSGSVATILTENQIPIIQRRISRVKKPEFDLDFPAGQ